VLLLRLRLPDDADPLATFGDSKAFMDMVLKALPLRRPVGGDNVRITSLGKAQQEDTFKDSYGRAWQLRTWRLPYNDTVMLTMDLPTPEGYIALTRECPTYTQSTVARELAAIAPFVYVSFEGTLKQWQGYRALAQQQPDVIRSFKIGFDYGKSFSFRSSRLALEIPESVQNIDATSILLLKMTYFNDGAATVWDVGSLYLSDVRQNANWVEIVRRHRPPDSLPEGAGDRWHAIETNAHPYTSTAYAANGGHTRIDTIVDAKRLAAHQTDTVYTVAVNNAGTQEQATMKKKLDQVVAGLSVLEK
jgi:serine protease Do